MTRIGIIALLSLVIGSFSPTSVGGEFSHPGGIAEIRIPKISNDLPVVRYGLKEPAILDAGNYWRVLLGIDLNQLPGEYVVYTRQKLKDEGAKFYKFEVMHKNYPLNNKGSEQRVGISNVKVLSELDFSNTQPPEIPMQLPFKANWNDQFGKLTIAKSGEGNSDIPLVQNFSSALAIENTLVEAPQKGIISNIITDKNNISVVVIDHGRGIYSLIHGVTDLTVQIGSGVVAGAMLGKVPGFNDRNRSQSTIETQNEQGLKAVRQATSKVHWQVKLNDVFVDPLILTQL